MSPYYPRKFDGSLRGIDFDDEEFGYQEEDKTHIKVQLNHFRL